MEFWPFIVVGICSLLLVITIYISIKLVEEKNEAKKHFNKELSSYYTKQAIKEAKDRQKLEKKF